MELKYHAATYELLTGQSFNTPHIHALIEERCRWPGERPPFDVSKLSPEMQASHHAQSERWIESYRSTVKWTKRPFYQRPPKTSPKRVAALDAVEARYGIALPAAVREWYALELVDDFASKLSGYKTEIRQFAPVPRLKHAEITVDKYPNMYFFLYGDEGGQTQQYIVFDVSAGDDPPVYSIWQDDVRLLESSFSRFVALRYWDWYTDFTFSCKAELRSPHFAIAPAFERFFCIPFAQLRYEFSELPDSQIMRFYDKSVRLLPKRAYRMVDTPNRFDFLPTETFCEVELYAETPDTFKDAIRKIWGESAPVFFLKPRNFTTESVIHELQHKQLRRVLRDANYWITGENIAVQLGDWITQGHRLLAINIWEPILKGTLGRALEALVNAGEVEAHPENPGYGAPNSFYKLKM